jgi:hypothetical protein
MIFIAITFLLSTFMMYDSGGRRGKRGAPTEPTEPTEDGRVQDSVVAVINGTELMRRDFERMVRNYVVQSNVRDLKSTDIPYLYQSTLEDAIFRIELAKEIEARRLDASEEEIKARINIESERYPTREAFFLAIERSGRKMDDLREEIKQQIIVDKTIQSAIATPPISDDVLSDFYDVMKGLLFSKPKGYKFDLIEVSVDKTAEELREKITGNLEKWQEIVSQDDYSKDVVRVTDEPLFFSEIALSNDKNLSFMVDLNVGEVGPVSEVSSNDFMIVIKRENVEETFTPFDEVSKDIRAMHEQQQQRSAYDKFRENLIGRAVLEIKDHSLFPTPVTPDVESAIEPESREVVITEPSDIKEEITDVQNLEDATSVTTPETTTELDASAVEAPKESEPLVNENVEEEKAQDSVPANSPEVVEPEVSDSGVTTPQQN